MLHKLFFLSHGEAFTLKHVTLILRFRLADEAFELLEPHKYAYMNARHREKVGYGSQPAISTLPVLAFLQVLARSSVDKLHQVKLVTSEETGSCGVTNSG